jgi:GH18 family chitinase
VTLNYNGIPTIQQKTRLAMERAGGVMIWALDHDSHNETSLLNAIFQTVQEGVQP